MSRRPLHVALNALYLEPGRSAGTETYLRGLVPALAAERPDLRLTVVTTRKGGRQLREEGWTAFGDLLVLRTDEGERFARLAAEQVAYPLAARGRGWDILHSLASVAPVRAPVRTVISLHDVTFFHHRTFSLPTTLAMRAIVRTAARHADALLTGSRAARDDISATLGIPAERIAVVHHGAGRPPAPASGDEADAMRRRLGIPDGARVVLTVGAIRPHKNQGLLLDAMPQLPGDVHLVLAGHEEEYAGELRARALDRVHFPGYVGDRELEALWGLADVAAFPTLAEGFGLPLVEALARGVPPAASDIAVLREVGGELPHWFDPRDPASAAAAIRAALGAPFDAAAARERADGFSWAEAARRTADVYDRVMDPGGG